VERTFEVTGPLALDVRVPAGSVEVDPTLEGAAEVVLTATNEESQRLVDAARIEVHRTAEGQELLVDVPGRAGALGSIAAVFGHGGIDCRIRCPQRPALSARTKSADVEVMGTLASADIATASGDVQLRDVDGEVNVKTASGDVAVGDVGGRASFATASGDVTVRRLSGAGSVATASGDVRIAAVAGDVKANTASGDVELGSVADGRIAVNSASGDVEVAVKRGTRTFLDCTTVSGDAHSELDGDDSAADGEGPLVEIRARTVSGDIRITRAQEVHA
jgi:putative adhesin